MSLTHELFRLVFRMDGDTAAAPQIQYWYEVVDEVV